jgi:hypothetical protein
VDTCRIRVGAAGVSPKTFSFWTDDAPWIVFFTEPYEADVWRAEAIYREILPRLCEVARRSGKTVVLKLHPFETMAQRKRLIRATLSEEDRKFVKVFASPLSAEILRSTWCAVTVESTVACKAATVGVPTFLCGWLRHAYSGYALQYARFGAARILEMPDDLLRIPESMREAKPAADVTTRISRPIAPETLAEVLLRQSARSVA